MTIERIAILGTGLIGASAGMALRLHGFQGSITGWDPRPEEAATAQRVGAIGEIATDAVTLAKSSDVVVLAGPVLTMLDWLERLAPVLGPHQLVTDVGSVKGALCRQAAGHYNGPAQPGFLPGHPMAGKEVGGAANADGHLFQDAVWIFTDPAEAAERSPQAQALALEWRGWIAKFGCRVLDMDPTRHDVLCAWISHLPQMLSTALSSLLEEQFETNADLLPIGGRALREMTRLGASPFSMWRDIAQTNTDAIAHSLLALEQRLAHLRENLKTPELRAEFEQANRFRLAQPKK
ncbi:MULTISPECIES: prephenate dehydrogenase [Acidobacterium]|uniref:Prephenate dehydrogenase n=1 Tax=Acidobacterium capsulatum (strain ATCC 51196 / DSM 11244 / BCRC 80197 / JCM 7670 / NBRC 15755 / NCIMB 13165 / 161) TaxID=240015 RepID=C1F7N4_ACIC5|nr:MULTISPECIES: prephenate dehydrogenase [Acidobacterium]ACO31562.1 prephenate dehydrogenase [Acidobacterium capsulatum ATCC 51196]HCT59654.1 prephenate dehydrogenase [Acidobacterium sp.]